MTAQLACEPLRLRSLDYPFSSDLEHHLKVREHAELQAQPLANFAQRPQAQSPGFSDLSSRHAFRKRPQCANLNRRERPILDAQILAVPPHFARGTLVCTPFSLMHRSKAARWAAMMSAGCFTGALAASALHACRTFSGSGAGLGSAARADRARQANSRMASFMIFYPLSLT